MTCPNKSYLKPNWKKKQPSYYGLDKFSSRVGLMEFIIKAAREFHRILMDDGCLWFKWGERASSTGEVVTLIHREGFQEMLRIPVETHGQYSKGAHWVMFMKKRETRE